MDRLCVYELNTASQYNSVMRATHTDWRRAKRLEVIDYLGGECVTCGFDDYRAFQIDHIKGGGTQERIRLGTTKHFQRILDGSTDYQLLCANCNWIKRVENQEYHYPFKNPTLSLS